MDVVSEAVISLSTLSSITVLKVYVSGTTGGVFVFDFFHRDCIQWLTCLGSSWQKFGEPARENGNYLAGCNNLMI